MSEIKYSSNSMKSNKFIYILTGFAFAFLQMNFASYGTFNPNKMGFYVCILEGLFFTGAMYLILSKFSKK